MFKNTTKTSLLLIVIISLITLIFYSFAQNLYNINEDKYHAHLLTFSKIKAHEIFNKLNNHLKFLQGVAQQFSSIDTLTTQQQIQLLDAMTSQTDFSFMLYVTPDGRALLNNGTQSDISASESFQQLLQTKTPFFSDVTTSARTGTDYFSILVPVIKNNEIVGAIVGIYPTAELNNDINVEFLGNEGYFHIIASDGFFVAKSKHRNVLSSTLNIFDLVSTYNSAEKNLVKKLADDIAQGKIGSIMLDNNAQNRFMTYVPLGINDWYVATSVPQNLLTKDSNEVSNLVADMMLKDILLLLVLFAYIIWLQRKASLQKKLEQDRYRIIVEKSGSIIFEYNFKTNIITYDKRWEKDFNLPTEYSLDLDNIAKRGNIHPDDFSILLKMFEDIKSGANYVAGEVRVKKTNGSFVWCAVDATNIFDNYRRPIRTVGSIMDISKQKDLEEKLKEEQIYRKNLMTHSDGFYEFDLTRNQFLQGKDKWIDLSEIALEHSTYDDFSFKYVHRLMFRDDIDTFMNLFSRETLLENFANGIKAVKFDYRRFNDNYQFIWVSSSAHLFLDEKNNDVKMIMHIKDIDEEKVKTLALENKATKDLLTNLYNKITTQEMINSYLAVSHSTEKHALFMIDIDNFKTLNDTLGHIFGDAVLSDLSLKMNALFRTTDIVGRTGGDEFIVLFKKVNKIEQLTKKADALITLFNNTYSSRNNTTCSISASIGIALYPQHGTTFAELYAHSDIAMYQSKQLGKGRYSIYTDELDISYMSDRIATDTIESNKTMQKNFADNIVEYVFRILYETNDAKLAIRNVLELIGKHFDVSRVYIFENSADDTYCSNSFEWCNENIPSYIESLQQVYYKDIGYYPSFFGDSDIWSTSIAEADPVIKQILEPQGIKRMYHFAFKENGVFRGAVGFDECIHNRQLNEYETSTLLVISSIVGAFLSKLNATNEIRNTLSTMTTIMDNLDSYTYVVDIDTHELLFINKKTFSIAPEVKLGDKCHKIFWNLYNICDFCPIKFLQDANNYHNLEIYNPKLKLWLKITFSLITWLDAKQVALVSSVDVTAYHNYLVTKNSEPLSK